MCSVVADSLQAHVLKPARFLWPWNFPGKNTGMGCLFLLHVKNVRWAQCAVVWAFFGQTGDGKSECRHSRNQRTKMDWNGWIYSDDYYIHYYRQESLRRNGVAIIVSKRVWNTLLGCILKNDRMISVRFQGKPFNIMVIQVYAPTNNAEEAEVKWFCQASVCSSVLSHHNKDLEWWTLKPSAHHSSWVLDKPCYSS